MCATYFIDDGIATEMLAIINELSKKYGYDTVTYDQIYPDGSPTGDIYPKEKAPVGTVGNDRVKVTMPAWGFPRKDSSQPVFNSRSDKLNDSFLWKKAYTTKRGFAPVRGFYETKTNDDGSRERYYFTSPDGDVLLLGTILETITDTDGNEYEVYSIITTEANDSVNPIHDRMPLILVKDELYEWLTDKAYADKVIVRTGRNLDATVKPREKQKADTEQTSLFE